MRERGEFMVRVDAQFDQNELKKLTNALKDMPKECKSGLVSAVNKSVKTTNTAMQKGVTQRYNIKKQSLTNGDFESASSSKLITVHQATKSSLNADILIKSHRLSFNVKRGMVSPITPKSHKGKTMKQIKRMSLPKVKVLKGKSKAFKGGFIATAVTTNEKGEKKPTTGLFSRDKSSGILKFHRTLSVSHMVRQKQIAEATQKAAKEALTKNVAHEIEYRLQKVSK